MGATTREDEIKETKNGVKVPKKKVIMMLGYCGIGYHGMQIQINGDKHVDTIEGKLFDAFLSCDLMTHDALKNPKLIQFQRCSRTDKNVSAMRQVISLKIPVYSDLVDKLNQQLPPDIRVFDILNVTKRFDSKIACTSRAYKYLLPSYAFSPTCEIDKTYRLTEGEIEEINMLCKHYIGTRNHRNFTGNKKPGQNNFQRYITKFTLQKTHEYDDSQWVDFAIEGQSFMIHQIRKMIGYVIASIKGYYAKEAFQEIFNKNDDTIPIAPGFGLILEQTFFSAYNKRYGNDGTHKKIEWSSYNNNKVEEFTKTEIIKKIVENEEKQNNTESWLQKLHEHHKIEAEKTLENKGDEKINNIIL